MRCPVCQGITDRHVRVRGYWILRCAACGHQFVEYFPPQDHPSRVYGDEYFEGGGAGYPDYLGEARILQAHGRRYARLMARFAKPGSILDVGAAAGFLLQGFVESGWSGTGLEPNGRMAQHASQRLGLEVVQGTLECLPVPGPFDLVLMIQVVGHLVDPRAAFGEAARATPIGGFWLIETWNPESWTARIFGASWHEYNPPSVLHFFPPQALCRLAGQFGLREITRGRPAKSIDGRHAKSLIRHNWSSSAWGSLLSAVGRLIPDGLQIPYPAEDLYWMIFQKIDS